MSEAAVGMRCQELVEVITDYLEGAMAPEDVERFDEHISLCEGCRIYLEQMRTTITALGHIPPESLDAEAEGADWTEVARIVLHIDPAQEPDRARRAWESHLARARWMTEHGYRHLLEGGAPH